MARKHDDIYFEVYEFGTFFWGGNVPMMGVGCDIIYEVHNLARKGDDADGCVIYHHTCTYLLARKMQKKGNDEGGGVLPYLILARKGDR